MWTCTCVASAEYGFKTRIHFLLRTFIWKCVRDEHHRTNYQFSSDLRPILAKGCWNTCSWCTTGLHYRAAFSAPCGQNATISVIVSVQWFHVPHLPSALKASGSKNKEEKEKNLIYKWIRQSTLKKTATHTLKKCCIQMERDSSVSVIQCSTASSLCLYFTDIKNREYQFFILNMSLQLSNLHKKNSKTMFEVKSRCCFLLQRRFNEPASQFYFAYPSAPGGGTQHRSSGSKGQRVKVFLFVITCTSTKEELVCSPGGSSASFKSLHRIKNMYK